MSTFSHKLAAVEYQNEEDKNKSQAKSKFFAPPPKSLGKVSDREDLHPKKMTSTKEKDDTINKVYETELSDDGEVQEEEAAEAESEREEEEEEEDTHLPAPAENQDDDVNLPAPAPKNPDDDAHLPPPDEDDDVFLSGDDGDDKQAKRSEEKKSVANDEPQPESWEKDFAEFPEHLKYFQKIRIAQKKANDTGKRTQMTWRGYRVALVPKMGKLKKYELLQRLIQALKNIKHHKPNEKNVSNLYEKQNKKNFLSIFIYL